MDEGIPGTPIKPNGTADEPEDEGEEEALLLANLKQTVLEGIVMGTNAVDPSPLTKETCVDRIE